MKTRDPKDNSLNDITNSHDWLKNLHTVFTYQPNLKKVYKGIETRGVAKPPELLEQLINFFTKKDQWVLDPFAGIGTTNIAAKKLNRNSVGIELYSDMKNSYKKLLDRNFPPILNDEEQNGNKSIFLIGNNLEVIPTLNQKFNLILTDPPYGINHRKRQDENAPFEMFGNDSVNDIGLAKNYEQFYERLANTFELCREKLVDKGWLVIFLGDRYSSKYIPVAYEANPYIENKGYVLKGVRIWNQPNVMRQVYGWWQTYVPVINHWNIMIYKKN